MYVYEREYNVDVVMCIDGTESMSREFDAIKEFILNFNQLFFNSMEESEKGLIELRVKIIVFRDYSFDSEPMVESHFYTMPDQYEELAQFIYSIEAHGGRESISHNLNEPSNSLEAIALALKSDWTVSGFRKRHVVLLLTDAPAIPLGACSDSPLYPSDMPADFNQLTNWWEGTDVGVGSTYQAKSGRFLAFVPLAEQWVNLQVWSRSWQMFEPKGTGGHVTDKYEQLLLATDTIVSVI